jgi:3-deoxy-manno-octulosonate cytidylyltransferase (CMP-KDO synthetase)
MLWHVWQACITALDQAHVLIATDHPVIADTMRAYGAKVVLTDANLPNGTQRCFAAWQSVSAQCPNVAHLINVQGDEPALNPEHLQQFIAEGQKLNTSIFTPRVKMQGQQELWQSPHVVKVVADHHHHALYFSRSPIPAQEISANSLEWHRHLGLYGFQISLLPRLMEMSSNGLSQLEQLEQLSWLEAGIPIGLVTLPPSGPAVDIPEDVMAVETWMKAQKTNA